MSNTGDKMKEGIHDAAEKVEDVAHNVGEKVKDAGHKVAEKTKDAAHDVGEKIKDAAHNVSEKTKEVVHNVGEKIKDAGAERLCFEETRSVPDGAGRAHFTTRPVWGKPAG